MSQSRTYFDLLDSFAETECPICSVALRGVQQTIDSLSYEAVNDPGFREQTRIAHGFCNVHAHQWLHSAHILGTALIYRQILIDASEELKQIQFQKQSVVKRILRRFRRTSIDHDFLNPGGTCPICLFLAEHETELISVLVKNLTDETFRRAYESSSGLCFLHLRQALATASNAIAFQTLCAVNERSQQQLQTQLHEIVRKYDYRFRNEPAGEEVGAAARAVAKVIGAQGLTQSTTKLSVGYPANDRVEHGKDINDARKS